MATALDLPRIRISYRDRSDQPDRSCGDCFNFVPDPKDAAAGRCFGRAVRAAGVCEIFASRTAVDLGSPRAMPG